MIRTKRRPRLAAMKTRARPHRVLTQACMHRLMLTTDLGR